MPVILFACCECSCLAVTTELTAERSCNSRQIVYPSLTSVSVSVSALDGIELLRKAHTRSAPSLSCFPKVALETVPVCVVEHRSFSTLEDGMSSASFLHSSLLQAISAMILWPVHVEKVSQASEQLALLTRCDICCACQSVCPFIPTDSD